MIKKLAPYTKGYRLLMLFAIACSAGEAVLELTLPQVMSDIVDIGIANGDRGYILMAGLKMVIMALLALGCHLCRTCQTGKCNWGIATQRPELVKRLNPDIGTERLINLMTAWKHEIMELMGGMGINSIEALRGNRLMLRGVSMTEKELEILGISHAGE